MRFISYLLLAAAAVGPAAAQTWDTSGNSMLKGTYYFRQMTYDVGDDYGDLEDAASLYGTVTFDGNGNYTMTATFVDAAEDEASSGTVTGTYSIAASGYGFITNALVSGQLIYGLVSAQGIFIGSSTEEGASEGFNDLFVAAPTSNVTVASLKGTYTIANLDVSTALEYGVGYVVDSMFTISPDGAGNLPSFSQTGFIGGSGASPYTQVVPAIKYTAANNAIAFTVPSSSTAYFLEGQQFLYISPDGNFIFGGGQYAWNFWVGVRTGTSTPNLSGLYYQAGMDENETNYSSDGQGLLDTYYGSFDALSGGVIIGHQRQSDILYGAAYGLTYADSFNVPSSGSYTDSTSPNGNEKYVVGAGGAIRIGSGVGPTLGLNVALQAPAVTGSGTWIDPQAVLNAASFAPFTAGVAPGELITVYGNNLAPSTQEFSTVPLPNSLAGVQLLVNGLAAPLLYVSSGSISAIVPYATAGSSIASITVNNNGTVSNAVTELVDETAPGVFTQQQNGVSAGSILHAADYSLVTSSNPAEAGETVAVYLTGLGAVNPAISDGSTGASASPFNVTTNTIDAYIGGTSATVSYAGLAPGLAALYQINLTVPTGLTAGNNILSIEGPDSVSAEAILPVGSGTADAVPATPHPLHPNVKPQMHRAPGSRLSFPAKQ